MKNKIETAAYIERESIFLYYLFNGLYHGEGVKKWRSFDDEAEKNKFRRLGRYIHNLKNGIDHFR